MFDFIIVGQGIAGSMLSWFLLKANQRVLVIDKFNPSSASHIASGVIKPITGKRYVKTWLADELIPFAKTTYHELENELGDTFFNEATFFKIFDSVKAQNDWSLRYKSPEYAAYLPNDKITYLDNTKVKNTFGTFEIAGGYRLDISRFLSRYRQWLQQKELLLNEDFNHQQLQLQPDSVTYKNISARKIIFCEGAAAASNPYFRSLPFQLAKGECLIVEIENFYTDKIINGDVLILPLPEKNHYYIGATHHWIFQDAQPSEQGKKELLQSLRQILLSPFKIISHYGAVRPTVKDRRPYLGLHQQHKNVGLFNGMGTKGVSLAPYFANHFAQHLLHLTPLHPEVSIERFLS